MWHLRPRQAGSLAPDVDTAKHVGAYRMAGIRPGIDTQDISMQRAMHAPKVVEQRKEVCILSDLRTTHPQRWILATEPLRLRKNKRVCRECFSSS